MALQGSEETGLGSVLTASGNGGGGGGSAGTLAEVYAAGAGAPITDDLMAMLHGNMRFQSPIDSAPLPLLGYWENVSGQSTAASGFPSELWSLAVIVGTDTGRRYSVFQMFDPAWNGTYAAINGMSWETERVTFTSDAAQKYQNQNVNPAFGSRDWKVLNNWAPASYPTGTGSHGTVEHETQLYNTYDLGLRYIDQLDGWGQTNRELTPQSNGITWQWASHWNATQITGAANDGIGWGIYSGDLSHFNHLQAGLTCRQVTSSTTGDWYWTFFVPDGSGGLLDVVDFAASGVTFHVPVTVPESALNPATRTAAISIGAGSTILFCGDSITKGYNGANNPLYRWQLYLEQWIASEFVDNGLTPPTILPTTAVSGQTSLDLLNDVTAQLTSQGANPAIIMIGTNDTVRTTGGGGGPPLTPAQTQANITGIINAALLANPSAKLIFVSPLFQTGENWPKGVNVTNGGDAAMDGVRSAIQAAVAAAPANTCQYIDISQYAFAWEASSNLSHVTSGLCTQDGTHPTHPLGQQVWGRAFFQQVALATQTPLFPVVPPPTGFRKTLGVAAGAFDFTNLSGLVDGGYEVDGEWQAGTGGDDNLIVQLGGATTGYTTLVILTSSSVVNTNITGDFGGGANTAGVPVGRAGGAANRSMLTWRFRVTPTDGTSTFYRVEASSEAVNVAGGTAFQAFMTQSAVPTGGNPLTEIKVTTKSGGGTKFGIGSWARVRRLGLTA